MTINDNKGGYAIKSDGELISVFNYGEKGQGVKLIKDAIKNGATKLNTFDGFLPEYYKQFGFKEVKRIKWNDKYAPKNWDYEKFGRPDIVYMELK